MWPMDPLLNTYNVENFTWKEITDFFQLLREDVNQDNIEIFVTAFYQKLRRSLELRKSQKYYFNWLCSPGLCSKGLHDFHTPTTTLLTQLFRTEQHLGPIHCWMVGDGSLTYWASVAGIGLLSVWGTITYDIKTNPTCREIKRGPVGSRECGW